MGQNLGMITEPHRITHGISRGFFAYSRVYVT